MGPQKCAIITGAAGSLGRALANAFADAYRLFLVDVDQEALQELISKFADARGVAADLGDVAQCRRAVDMALAGGPVDVLINNAAICPRVPFLETPEETLERVWRVNFKAAYLLAQTVVPHMDRGASIVNIISPSAYMGGLLNVSAYAASKAALANLTKSLARELGPKGIRVNSVSPGLMHSRMMDNVSTERLNELLEGVPLGRLAEPDEVAQAVRFLCQPGASFTTGSTLFADGGLTMI